MKLSKTQQNLYDAMKHGVICHYMEYMGRFRPRPYYFRTDTHKHCTAAANALVKKGLVEKYNQYRYSGKHKLRIKP